MFDLKCLFYAPKQSIVLINHEEHKYLFTMNQLIVAITKIGENL